MTGHANLDGAEIIYWCQPGSPDRNGNPRSRTLDIQDLPAK